MTGRTAFALACALCTAATAWAQTPAPRAGQLTVSAGLVVSAGHPVGDRNAELRRNTTGVPPPFTLFRAESEIERGVGVEGRVSVGLTEAFAIEAGGSYMRPRLGITISADPEVDTAVEVSERLSQYTIDVSGVYYLTRVRIGARMRPYILGGAGYLRQLYEDRLLVETGQTLHGGGGVQYWMRGLGPKQRPVGARLDVRIVRRTGGIDFEDRARTYPRVSMLAFVGF